MGQSPADIDEIEIECAGFSGRQRPDAISVASDPDIDLALVELRPPKGVDPSFATASSPRPLDHFNVGDEVVVSGYANVDGACQVDRLRVLGVHGGAGALICNKAVPEGYSGGPVMCDDVLVGVMFARHFEQGQSYFWSGEALLGMLRASPAPLSWHEGSAISPLRAFPLGPGIGANDVLVSLQGVIDCCVRLFPGNEAVMRVIRATSLRKECGPDSGPRGYVEINELPTANGGARNFWMAAFIEAGLKSPRMLAALLTSVDEDEGLDEPARREKDAMLARLAALPTNVRRR
jgi:hypothetical protein